MGTPEPAARFGVTAGNQNGIENMFSKRSLLALTGAGLLALAAPAPTAQAVPAQNVILMVTDGASWGTWDMASYWQYGALGRQSYDSFPVRLGMTTFPLNTSSRPTNTGIPRISYDPARAWSTTPTTATTSGRPDFFAGYNYIKRDFADSAAAGTALAAGVRTYNNAINFDDFGNPVRIITEQVAASGRASGVVSTVPFTHATPAAFGAQNISRNNYHAIAEQMLRNRNLDVIMGTGNPTLNSNGEARAMPNETFMSVAQLEALRRGDYGRTLIETRAQFEALADGTMRPTGPVMGLPLVGDTLQYNRSAAVFGADAANPSGVAFNPDVPSLATMTLGALNLLNRNPNGFFLMSEGGAVDWAAHANNTARIIEEQVDFNLAVDAVVDWVTRNSSWDETLLIVLTDHGNGIPMGPNSDTVPFQPIQNNGAGVLPGVRWHSGTHTNENTLFFARGAGAETFNRIVLGVDPGLRDVLGFNDGSYITNTQVFDVMNAAFVPAPASVLALGFGLAALAAARRVRAGRLAA